MNKEPIKIPEQFELLGQTIKVIWDNDRMNDKELYGEARYGKNIIILSDKYFVDGKMKRIPQDKINHTFIHELMHFILHNMGSKLDNDENFIDLFSGLLYQFFKSAKYAQDKKQNKEINQ